MKTRKQRKADEFFGVNDPGKVIVRKERIKGVWFNDVTGNLHRTHMVKITRRNGSIDRGDYHHAKQGEIPKHPTTGEPLWTPRPTTYIDYRPIHDKAPDHLMGLRINPEPLGTLVKGVVMVKINGVSRSAAQIAWKKQTGEELPKGTRIRHKDGNPWNNHISNLERAGLGTGGTYQAATRVSGVRVSLGSFRTREAAVEAVRAFRESVGAGPVRAYRRKTVTTAAQSATL
jgi:hypothetical protein